MKKHDFELNGTRLWGVFSIFLRLTELNDEVILEKAQIDYGDLFDPQLLWTEADPCNGALRAPWSILR